MTRTSQSAAVILSTKETILIPKKKICRRPKLKIGIEESASSSMNFIESSSSKCNTIVKFGIVTVREYHVIPGDNPSVSAGPPLTIDWNPVNTYSASINTFEEFRDGKRRDQSHMEMSSSMRELFLLEQGHTMHSIEEASKQASLIRSQRIQTASSPSNDQQRETMMMMKKISIQNNKVTNYVDSRVGSKTCQVKKHSRLSLRWKRKKNKISNTVKSSYDSKASQFKKHRRSTGSVSYDNDLIYTGIVSLGTGTYDA